MRSVVEKSGPNTGYGAVVLLALVTVTYADDPPAQSKSENRVLSTRYSERASQTFPPKDTQPASSAKSHLLQGTASCAAAACHHGAGNPGVKGSEYSTWVSRDPHTRAFTVLYETPSLQMHQRLRKLKSIEDATPFTDKLCLNCHVYHGIDAAAKSDRFAAIDGVACEACHGPAEKWLAAHYSDQWKSMSEADKAARGFKNTKNLVSRAETCVGCHVGSAIAEVNHDLIAAGHPRLNFEFSSYLSLYPKHWNIDDDKRRHQDHEARAWLQPTLRWQNPPNRFGQACLIRFQKTLEIAGWRITWSGHKKEIVQRIYSLAGLLDEPEILTHQERIHVSLGQASILEIDQGDRNLTLHNHARIIEMELVMWCGP